MNRQRLLLVVILATLASFLLSSGVFAGSQSPAVVTKNSIEWEDESVNCNEDTVTLNGIETHVLRTVTDGNGGFNAVNLRVSRLSGESASDGTKYIARKVTQQVISGSVGETITTPSMLTIVGQGVGTTYTIHSITQYTVDKNGDVKVDFFKESMTCR